MTVESAPSAKNKRSCCFAQSDENEIAEVRTLPNLRVRSKASFLA